MSIQQIVTRLSFSILAWCTLVVAPASGQSINHEPLFTIHGDFNGEQFGKSLSGAGDVNGDGVADLIVGAPNEPNDGTGSARVFSGVDGSVLYTFDGNSPGDLFGFAVSGAGDVNGDGFADLIVGAPSDDPNGQNSGSARVFSGVDGSVLYTFDGDSSDGFFGDNFGVEVSGAGDVNGDGVADFVVGASGGGTNGGGYVRVFVSQITLPILFGDCNQDGVVDFSDISAFIELLTTDSYLEEADVNQDDVVSPLDIAPFIEILISV